MAKAGGAVPPDSTSTRRPREEYATKAPTSTSYPSPVTAAEAVAGIPSGSRVFVGSGCGAPQVLIKVLTDRAAELRDVEICHLLTFGIADYVNAGFEGSFRHNAFFIGPNVRQAVSEGRADYTPIFLSEISELIRSGQRPVDVCLLQLSPPDRHGYCSMGIHVDIQRAALESAKVVIAEINPRMSRTFGDGNVHISQIDALIDVDYPLLELPSKAVIDETSIEIGGHVARLISHGSCLQLGIGSIPDAVLRFLEDKWHLGIHTEMFSDGVLGLIQNGNVDNSRKEVLAGKTLTSFTMGTQKLYDFVHDNPTVEYRTSAFVNNPRVICRNEKVVAVNSALQVDLTGQVCSDSLGYRFFSGIGGQVDFIRGAAMSRGGKPIIALPSTAKDGTISRIAPHLDEGAGVVTSRGDVHYVVTEWGIAYLHGKTVRERALALINITHPDFRQELLDFVKEKHYVFPSDRLPERAKRPDPKIWETWEMFGDLEAQVRPIDPTDERGLQEFFYSHDRETIYNRYFTTKRELGHEEATHLCTIGYHHRMAFGIFRKEEGGLPKRFVAIGRYDFNPRTGKAETAIVVDHRYRRRGIATYLLRRLAQYAKTKEIFTFRSEILAGNNAMLELHRRLGHEVRWNADSSTYIVHWRFEDEDLGDPAAPGGLEARN